MGIRARCDEELQVQSGLWLIIAKEEARYGKKFVRDFSKRFEPSRRHVLIVVINFHSRYAYIYIFFFFQKMYRAQY